MGTGRAGAVARRARIAGRLIRRVTAAVLGPVVAAGTSIVPVVVTAGVVAGVAAVAVAKAPAAKAQSGPSVLVLLQNDETTAPETTVLQAAGYSVTQQTPAQWAADSTSYFEGFAALVIGDPSSGSCSSLLPVTGTAGSGQESIGTNWQAAVTGNLAVLGTAPALPGTTGADSLISDAVGYAAASYSSSGSTGTGLYVSLNCEYSTAAAGTSVPLLSGVEGIGNAGGLMVNGSLSCGDAGTVNTWEADAAGTFSGFTIASLGTGSNAFPSPACPVEEAFDSWPASFTPVAYDSASDATANFTASDGVQGQPYILLGTPPVTTATQAGEETLALAPSTGGEVPAGTTTGGGSNPAAAGASQATAGDPVNTEDGDFTQSATDLSVPTFGPGLDFTRTYDADVAEQQTQAGTPGPLGYGWSDDWASSLTAASAVPGDIYTVAGLGTDDGLGGPATSAALAGPASVAVSGGNTYIADAARNQVLEIPGSSGTQWGIPMTAGDVYLIVGSPTGATGLPASGTPASQFSLKDPSGVAVDSRGDLLIADTKHDVILELAASSDPWGAGQGDIPATATPDDVYYLAGNTVAGTSGDSGPAYEAELNHPIGIFTGGSAGDNLYIADAGNNRIQEVPFNGGTQHGVSYTAWDMYTAFGSASGASGDTGNGTGGQSALFNGPDGVAVSGGGYFIADTGNCKVVEFPKAAGTQWGISMAANAEYTVAGRDGDCTGGANGKVATSSDLDDPMGIGVDSAGDLYIADSGSNVVKEVFNAGGQEFGQSMTADYVYAITGSLINPEAVTADSSGNLYIADTGDYEVKEVSASSPYSVTVVAGNGFGPLTEGNGGPALTGALNSPMGMTSDPQGDLYIADYNNCRVQEIAASTHTQWGIAMTAGDVYTVAGSAKGTCGDSGDGGLATSALIGIPWFLTTDSAGDLYIDDYGENQVQEVAATSHTQWGQSMTAGDIYTVAGSTAGTSGSSGLGGPATSALLNDPYQIATDSQGDLYIAGNCEVDEIYNGGQDWGQAMTAGDIYDVAGLGPGECDGAGDGNGFSPNGTKATSALLSPSGIALDAAGNLYIGDGASGRVEEVAAATHTQWGQKMTADDVYNVAGNAGGTLGDSGDGGPATSALLGELYGIGIDSAGDLLIPQDNQVQVVAAQSGTQWGQQMRAGDIYTIAGSASGTEGDTGNGGPATSALISVQDVTADPAGDVFISDYANNQIREVAATSTASLPVSPAVSGDISVTQPGDAQVTFYAQSGGSCIAPQLTAGGYCVLPADQGATLTSNSNDTYTFVPSPGSDSYTYSWDGNLISEADTAGETLTITYDSPAPGSAVSGDSSEVCPSTATTCETIASASGRALVIGSNSSGMVTTVTDPMGRQWTYAYNSADDLTSATDPMGNVTSYTYGPGANGPLQANDLLTITDPNAQPGYTGSDADSGADTINVYNSANQVTSQTDPMGNVTSFNYCVNATAGDCMNPATGNGLVTVTDPDGNDTVYSYDQGTLAAEADWTGATGAALTSQTQNIPDTTVTGSNPANDGSLLNTATFDGDQNETSYTYDTAGDVIATTGPSGGSTPTALQTTYAGFTTQAQGDEQNCEATAEATATCSQDPGPEPVTAGGTITPPSSAPPEGLTYTLYDSDGNELYNTTGVYEPGATSAAYSQTTYQLFKGNTVTLPGSSTAVSCTYTPPSASLPCATIDADGVVTQLGYDSQGDLTSSSIPDGNGSQLATTTYAYDADGEQTSTVSPDGNVSGANAGNYATTTVYNADGDRTSVTQGDGPGYTDTPRTTSYSYDADGNQTSVTDARGYTTTSAFNADDNEVTTTDPDSGTTLTCYDAAGDVVQTVPAAGVASGSLTPASCPTTSAGYASPIASDASTYSFDAAGDETASTSPAPAGQSNPVVSTTTYDGDGNTLESSSPPDQGSTDQQTVNTYNSAGEVASSTANSSTSSPSITTYCYDPNGDVTSVVAPDGNTNGTATCETSYPWVVSTTSYPTQSKYQTTYSYDSVGDLVSTTMPATAAAPSGATTTRTYDPDGNVLTSTDPNGVTTTWTYTPNGNVATISYSGSSAHSVSYTYDADGQMTSMVDATGTSTYTWDPFGELTSYENGAGQTVSYSYDADGDTTGITYPLPSTATWATTDTVTYGYDKADVLDSVTDFNGRQITIGNTADGLPDSESLGSTGDTIAIGYDQADDPESIALQNSSAKLQSFTYTYNAAGDLATEVDYPSGSQTYSYDAMGRIASVTSGTGSSQSYSFDPSGNLLALPGGATGTYNAGQELVSSTLDGTATSYTYNADGQRLAAAQGSTAVESATWNGADELTSYTSPAGSMTSASYDGNGLRASDVINGVTQSFTWNAAANVSQLLMDSTNAYIYADGGTPIEQVNLSTGTPTYLMSDSMGSVRGVISSSGSLLATTSYDAWGNPQTSGGLTSYTPFGYAGAYTDPTGLQYLINRYYDPATGQFISVDPEVSESQTPYGYAGGDPINEADPTGASLVPGGGGGGGGCGPDCKKSLKAMKSDYDYYLIYKICSALPSSECKHPLPIVQAETDLYVCQHTSGVCNNHERADAVGYYKWVLKHGGEKQLREIWDCPHHQSICGFPTKKNWVSIVDVAGYVIGGGCTILSAGAAAIICGGATSATVAAVDTVLGWSATKHKGAHLSGNVLYALGPFFINLLKHLGIFDD
jgi:RHS repeat-associated protein